jgi:hypothetical protein
MEKAKELIGKYEKNITQNKYRNTTQHPKMH